MNETIKKVLNVILFIIGVFLFLYVANCFFRVDSFNFVSGEIYEAYGKDTNYILEIKDKHSFSVYQYVDTGTMIYGLETDYVYSGIKYNQLISSIHIYPGKSWTFWSDLAFYDNASEQRARITMKVKENKAFQLEYYEPVTGSFDEEVIVTSDSIKLGDIQFDLVPDSRYDWIQAILLTFNTLAK